ncbi:MAG: hypothetical protein QNJ38_09200 [Prochloraceae cyanobacterium]|nr:hypothetical protein [Prochloraceae cyanobacterium]
MNYSKKRKSCSIAKITAIATLSLPTVVLPVAAKNLNRSYYEVSRNHAKCLQKYDGKQINGHQVEVKGEEKGKINITKHIIIPLTVELTYAYDFTQNTLNVSIINSPVAYDKVWKEANKIVNECR